MTSQSEHPAAADRSRPDEPDATTDENATEVADLVALLEDDFRYLPEGWPMPTGKPRRWYDVLDVARADERGRPPADRSPVWVPQVHGGTRVIIGMGLVALVLYAAFVLDPRNRGDLVPYLALVAAELVLIANLATTWLTSLFAESEPPIGLNELRWRERLDSDDAPSIDVFVAVYGEPLNVIRRTATAARDLRGRHRTIICDDGRSDEVRELCGQLGVEYVRRNDRRGVKAGNINTAMMRTDGEFIAVFDADHVAHPDFLLLTIPYLAADDVAFVQTPQAYVTDGGTFVEIGSADAQDFFYSAVCPGKNRFNSAFHVGTNAVFRRRALEDVGGFYEDTNSEDIWTSIRLHSRGWRSIHLPHIVARGLSPTTVDAHLTQQFRWASGAYEIALWANALGNPRLTPTQRWQYLQPALHFLQGFSNLVYLLLPPLFLLFGTAPLETTTDRWLLAFVPLYVGTQLVMWAQNGRFLFRPIVMSLANAPVHAAAFLSVLLRREATWESTNQAGHGRGAIERTAPHIVLVAINLAGLVVAFSPRSDRVGTTVCAVLCAVHALLLLRIVGEAFVDRRRSRSADTPIQAPAHRVGPGPVRSAPALVGAPAGDEGRATTVTEEATP